MSGVILDGAREASAGGVTEATAVGGEGLLAAQNRALEIVAGPAPLAEALGALARIVEEQSAGDAVASILLLAEDGGLWTGAAPSLPAEYCKAIDGIKAAAGVGTCCEAAALNTVVVTEDFASARSWEGLAHLPLGLGLKGAWSMPIRGSDGRVLGTFGTYFRQCRGPSGRERAVVEGLCRAAALAIERRRAEEALRESEGRLADQKEALELAVSGAPIGEVLDVLARAGRRWFGPGSRTGIYLVDGERKRLRLGATAGMGEGYTSKVVHIPIDPAGPACASAAFTGEAVIAADVMVDPRWAPYLELVAAHEIRACWSFPVHSADRSVAGTYAVYFREPRSPGARDVERATALAKAAALVIARHEVGEALRENDKKLRVALGAADMGAWTYRMSDGRWEVDARAQELYGTGAAVVTHDDALMSRVMHPDDVPVMWRAVRRATDPAGAGRYECEYRIRHGAGWRWVAAWAQVEFEGEGEQRRAVRMVGSSRDITAGKVAQEELRRAKEAAERSAAEAERLAAAAGRASAAKSDFLATLSHELRTPLTPVLLTVSLMEGNPRLPGELKEDVANIRRNVELESRLIGDLLDLTRIERGKMELDRQDVDLHLIVRSAVDICQREASARLTLDLVARGHTVEGDNTRLQQVIWNLVNNAIKFTPAGGEVVVRSRDVDGGARVRVEVSDTGTGIDPAVLPRLFNAFEQGEAEGGKRRAGLGLGLAISKKLVEAHGGTIVAHSAGRGRGATFAVELPVVAERARGAGAAPGAERALRRARRALKVLLVEDHEPTRRVMERLLRQIGHTVTGVGTVASASAAAQQDGFDLIISDLGLPDGSGLDIMRELKERYAGRAIALSGYGMESDVAASRAAGFAEHVTKPVDLAALEAAIGRVAGKG